MSERCDELFAERAQLLKDLAMVERRIKELNPLEHNMISAQKGLELARENLRMNGEDLREAGCWD